MAQLKYQNTHKMALRGEEENGAIWLEHKTSWAIYVACVKDPIEKNRRKIAHIGWPIYFKMKR